MTYIQQLYSDVPKYCEYARAAYCPALNSCAEKLLVEAMEGLAEERPPFMQLRSMSNIRLYVFVPRSVVDLCC
ncbi:hypothetical protein OH77DRAFT_1432208 [Trametes cingulata]|nr:hypothetical protein OH77DRAFT_1432208 [Trametes cingulata]